MLPIVGPSIRSLEPEYRLDRDTGGRLRERLVDLIEAIELDELVEGEAAGFVVFDELRNEHARNGVALDHADHAFPFRHQVVVHVDLHHGRYPDDGRLAQWTERIETLPHDRRHASALDRGVGSAAGGFFDDTDHVDVLAVQRIGRAELSRELEAAVVDVDREDPLAAGNLRRHDRAQADRTAPVDGDRAAERKSGSAAG